MRVGSLTLKNFRNYAEQTLTFSPGKNIFLGANGHGKTNLLETLYLLSHSKSHRASSDRELIRFGEAFTTIQAVVQTDELSRELNVTISTDDHQRLKTKFKQNGVAVKSRAAFLGYLPSVSFLTPDLNLLRGAPDHRRRWLDGALVQYEKRYFSVLANFNKIRQQKSGLLKRLEYPVSDSAITQLDLWNEQFAQAAADVLLYRLLYLKQIQQAAPVRYETLSGGQETLKINYEAKRFVLENLEELSVESLTAQFLKTLKAQQQDELRRQQCLIGPHRDDIQLLLSDKQNVFRPASDYGSQGQQRSIVLALKLTELQLLRQQLDEAPILLLDDVMAELDPLRQQFLMDAIGDDLQVFITTTHLDTNLSQNLSPVIQRYLNEDESKDTVRVFEVKEGQAFLTDVTSTNNSPEVSSVDEENRLTTMTPMVSS